MFVAVLFVMPANEANTELPRTDLEDVSGGATNSARTIGVNRDDLLQRLQALQETIKAEQARRNGR